MSFRQPFSGKSKLTSSHNTTVCLDFDEPFPFTHDPRHHCQIISFICFQCVNLSTHSSNTQILITTQKVWKVINNHSTLFDDTERDNYWYSMHLETCTIKYSLELQLRACNCLQQRVRDLLSETSNEHVEWVTDVTEIIDTDDIMTAACNYRQCRPLSRHGEELQKHQTDWYAILQVQQCSTSTDKSATVKIQQC